MWELAHGNAEQWSVWKTPNLPQQCFSRFAKSLNTGRRKKRTQVQVIFQSPVLTSTHSHHGSYHTGVLTLLLWEGVAFSRRTYFVKLDEKWGQGLFLLPCCHLSTCLRGWTQSSQSKVTVDEIIVQMGGLVKKEGRAYLMEMKRVVQGAELGYSSRV